MFRRGGILTYRAFRRHTSTGDTRKELYMRCLNRDFDSVLSTLRKLPDEQLDYEFLHIYLERSCQWGHMASVDYLWHRYVLDSKVLVVRPHLLVQMGNLALASNRLFVTQQIYRYFEELYGKNAYDDEAALRWKYELLRIKVESFARGTLESTTFREKWKVLLEDMDQVLPTSTVLSVRDFPYLREALKYALATGSMDVPALDEMLFTETKISIRNSSTLPLLLNLALAQGHFSPPAKVDLFKRFFSSHPQLPYDDSLCVLARQFRSDGYSLAQILDFVTTLHPEGKITTSPVARRLLTSGLSDSEYSYKLQEHPELLPAESTTS